MSWTLGSADTPDDIPDMIEDGVYSLIPTSDCHLKSTSDEQVYNIWFMTPVSCFISPFLLNLPQYSTLGSGRKDHPED